MIDTEKLAPILDSGNDNEEIADYSEKFLRFYRSLTPLERCVFNHRFVHEIKYTLKEIGEFCWPHGPVAPSRVIGVIKQILRKFKEVFFDIPLGDEDNNEDE